MPKIPQGETQQIRLTDVPVSLVRLAKARAALEGKSTDRYITELLVKYLRETEIVEPA